MAPCVVVEKLEGNQQCSRAPVGEHAEVQAQDADCGCHEQQEVNEKQPKPRNSPSHNHDSTATRQHPLIYTGAGSIHPVHGPLLSPATEAIAPKGFTSSPFWRVAILEGGGLWGVSCVQHHKERKGQNKLKGVNIA